MNITDYKDITNMTNYENFRKCLNWIRENILTHSYFKGHSQFFPFGDNEEYRSPMWKEQMGGKGCALVLGYSNSFWASISNGMVIMVSGAFAMHDYRIPINSTLDIFFNEGDENRGYLGDNFIKCFLLNWKELKTSMLKFIEERKNEDEVLANFEV